MLLYYRNKGVAAFLGSEMWEQLGRYETEPPGECGTVFRSTCPWDSRGITSIVMKLMVRRKLSLLYLSISKELCNNFLFAIMQSYFLSWNMKKLETSYSKSKNYHSKNNYFCEENKHNAIKHNKCEFQLRIFI